MTRKTPDDKKPLPEATETFVPAVSFEGYPDGKTPVKFVAGTESPPVSKAYAELIRAKGLARPSDT